MRFADFLKDQKIIVPRHVIKKPLVSVIMPTYCRAHDNLLSQAITGVLSQTFSDFEFIILDDGSIDGSESIIRDFQRHDDRIIYVRHEINSGLPALRVDEGILLSKGDYIAFQFDDDNWLPSFLEVITSETAKRNKTFIHCQAEYLIGDHVTNPSFPAMQPTYASLLQRNSIANVSVLLHKSVLMSYGLYDPHVVLRRVTDWDLWLRIAKHKPPYLVPEVLVRSRGGLPDSIGCQVPSEYENFSLMFQAYRDADLIPERIMDTEVNSLDSFAGNLPKGQLHKVYNNQIVPWLNQRKEQFANFNISTNNIKALKTKIHHIKLKIYFKNTIKKFIVQLLRFGGVTYDIIKRLFHHPVLYFVVTYCRRAFHFLHDAWNSLPSSFMDLKNDPLMVNYRCEGFLLKQSANLRHCDFILYPLAFQAGSLYALSLAFLKKDYNIRGSVGLELVSLDNKIVGHALTLVSYVTKKAPTKFFFEPPLKPGKYYLRIFGNDLNAPIYIRELYKYEGTKIVKKPFCGLMLE